MKIALVWGAGNSISAGVPSTGELTSKILAGSNVWRDTTGGYFERTEQNIDSSKRLDPKIIGLLAIVNKRCSDFFLTARMANYEDIAYVVSQLAEKYDNPAIIALSEEISNTLFPECDRATQRSKLTWLASETLNYIKKYLQTLINIPIGRIEHLEILKEMIDDEEIETIEIFSYNHDLLLENFFSQNGIASCDGFDVSVDGVRLMNLSLYNTTDSKVKLYKLHGSIDWHQFIFRRLPPATVIHLEPAIVGVVAGEIVGDIIGIPTDNEFNKEKVSYQAVNCSREVYTNNSPLILIGTDNKLFDYQLGSFLKLQSLLQSALSNADKIVIAGSSCGDRALRVRIYDEIVAVIPKEVIIINPVIESVKVNLRGPILDRVKLLPYKIEDVKWENGNVVTRNGDPE